MNNARYLFDNLYCMFQHCAPCRQLIPEIRKVAAEMTHVNFGTVDCTTHQALCNEKKVRSYPTTIMYNMSKPFVNIGFSNAQALKEFIEVSAGQNLTLYFRGLLFTSQWLNLQHWTGFYIAVYGNFQGLFFAFLGWNRSKPRCNFFPGWVWTSFSRTNVSGCGCDHRTGCRHVGKNTVWVSKM